MVTAWNFRWVAQLGITKDWLSINEIQYPHLFVHWRCTLIKRLHVHVTCHYTDVKHVEPKKKIVIPIDTFSVSTFQIPSNYGVFWDIPISDPKKMCLHLWLHKSRPVVALSCSLASEFFEPQVLGEKAAGHLEMWR